MKTIKVSEATPIQLDWLVAKLEGLSLHKDAGLAGVFKRGWWVSGLFVDPNKWVKLGKYNPTSNWAQGGPIIEREHLSIEAYSAPNDEGIACFWYASEDKFDAETWDAPTPLIAAMRCYVASKLGDEVEIPEELE